VKDPILLKYYHKVQTLLQYFSSVKMEHVRREHNSGADLSSKLASTKKKNHHHSVVQQMVETPSVTEKEENCDAIEVEECWYEPIRNYLLTGECSDRDLCSMEVKSSRYTLVGDDLYRRGYSRPLLKCITQSQAKYLLEELHQEICGLHSGVITTMARVLRAGYY